MGRRYLAIGAVLILILAGAGIGLSLLQQDPAAPVSSLEVPNAEVTKIDRVVQVLWNEHSDDLTGDTGWKPVSLRHVETPPGQIIYGEIRNTTDRYRAAPTLVLVIVQDDAPSLTFSMAPSIYWVQPGKSAFYSFVYQPDQTIDPAHWSELLLITSGVERDADEGIVLEQISIEDDVMHNNSEIDAPGIFMETVVRDAEGIYSGSCFGPTSNGPVPAGSGTTFNQWPNPEDLPQCGFAEYGMEASEDLGIGGPFTREEHLGRFDQPDP